MRIVGVKEDRKVSGGVSWPQTGCYTHSGIGSRIEEILVQREPSGDQSCQNLCYRCYSLLLSHSLESQEIMTLRLEESGCFLDNDIFYQRVEYCIITDEYVKLRNLFIDQ